MLVKNTIKAAVKEAFTAVMSQEENRADALDKVADKLATAIVDAIKSMEITYSTGLVAPPSGGPVTGMFTCTIA